MCLGHWKPIDDPSFFGGTTDRGPSPNGIIMLNNLLDHHTRIKAMIIWTHICFDARRSALQNLGNSSEIRFEIQHELKLLGCCWWRIDINIMFWHAQWTMAASRVKSNWIDVNEVEKCFCARLFDGGGMRSLWINTNLIKKLDLSSNGVLRESLGLKSVRSEGVLFGIHTLQQSRHPQ